MSCVPRNIVHATVLALCIFISSCGGSSSGESDGPSDDQGNGNNLSDGSNTDMEQQSIAAGLNAIADELDALVPSPLPLNDNFEVYVFRDGTDSIIVSLVNATDDISYSARVNTSSQTVEELEI